MRCLNAAVCLVVATLAAGCASAPLPAAELKRAQVAVREAAASGAETDPRAALHLKLAQEQLAVAKQLLLDGRNRRARALLQRACADAELAVALTRQTAARREAERARAAVRLLLHVTEGTDQTVIDHGEGGGADDAVDDDAPREEER